MNSSSDGIGRALAKSVRNMTAPLSTQISSGGVSRSWSAATAAASSAISVLQLSRPRSARPRAPPGSRGRRRDRRRPRRPAARPPRSARGWTPADCSADGLGGARWAQDGSPDSSAQQLSLSPEPATAGRRPAPADPVPPTAGVTGRAVSRPSRTVASIAARQSHGGPGNGSGDEVVQPQQVVGGQRPGPDRGDPAAEHAASHAAGCATMLESRSTPDHGPDAARRARTVARSGPRCAARADLRADLVQPGQVVGHQLRGPGERAPRRRRRAPPPATAAPRAAARPG